MNDFFKKSLQTSIRDLREIQIDKEHPCLLGCGHTIVYKDTAIAMSRQGAGYNFTATWNRGSCYWTEETARKGAEQIKDALPFDVEVIHYNDLRARHEKVARESVSVLFKNRHSEAFNK